MAESDEHRFLTDATLDVLRRMAGTRLYGYREADRRTFDFACDLVRDWERGLTGQTLWKHIEGVDKDVRTMLADDEADICLYIAQDTTRARNIFQEAVADYRRAFSESRAWRLRVVWIPSDFRVDVDGDRYSIISLLEEELTRDLLLNVVLGNISAESIGLFIRSTGAIGLDLALLAHIAFFGFTNMSSLARAIGVSKSPLPERMVRLLGCGFLAQPDPTGSFFHVTVRGRVFLELCREVVAAGSQPSPELHRVLQLLDIAPPPSGESSEPRSQSHHGALASRVSAAIGEFGVDLSRTDYVPYWEGTRWPRGIPRPRGPS